MKIQHFDNAEQGAFFICDEQGKRIAELTYIYRNSQTIDANHTYVAEVLRGQGVADKLYRELVTLVKTRQLKLIPSCSYIEKKWEREER